MKDKQIRSEVLEGGELRWGASTKTRVQNFDKCSSLDGGRIASRVYFPTGLEKVAWKMLRGPL